MEAPKRVLITGAAGQIAYSLIFAVARGDMLGPEQPVILHLLDIAPCQESLKGVVMEIDDCAFPLVKGIVATTDTETAFTGVEYCLMTGAFPRRPGMERKDLLEKNAAIFRDQGQALEKFANPNVKVCVVGNPANTNCLIAQRCAPGLPKENFSCLTRLDHNRAVTQIAKRLHVDVRSVKNVIIWGNHSSTQYPDVSHGTVHLGDGVSPIRAAVNDDAWLKSEFIATVQQRGAAVMQARQFSSAASAAKAIVDHMKNWVFGTAEGEFVSMGIVSDGSYNVPAGLVYSFPVSISSDGVISIVQGLSVDDFSREKMVATQNELEHERDLAFAFLGL